MKNFILMSAATISVAGLLMMGCRKDGTQVINNDLDLRNSGQTIDKSIFDDIGKKHNELLTEYGDDLLDQGVDYAKQYFDSVLISQGIYTERTPNHVLELFRDANGYYYDDVTQEINAMREKYKMIGIDSVLFSSIIDRFYEFADGLGDNSGSKQEMLSFIDHYESQIDREEMSYEERVSILTSLYLCRHSIDYWSNSLDKKDLTNTAYEKKKKNKGKFWRGFWCTSCVSLFDATGGLAAAGTGPWSVLAGAAAASLYAQYCVCPTCAKYGSVSCNKK